MMSHESQNSVEKAAQSLISRNWFFWTMHFNEEFQRFFRTSVKLLNKTIQNVFANWDKAEIKY